MQKLHMDLRVQSKGEILSSHDILDYSNTYFTKSFAPTCSETLRHFITNSFYLISL